MLVLRHHKFESLTLCKVAQMRLRSTLAATVSRSYVVRSRVSTTEFVVLSVFVARAFRRRVAD
jgi:hypothetical protein